MSLPRPHLAWRFAALRLALPALLLGACLLPASPVDAQTNLYRCNVDASAAAGGLYWCWNFDTGHQVVNPGQVANLLKQCGEYNHIYGIVATYAFKSAGSTFNVESENRADADRQVAVVARNTGGNPGFAWIEGVCRTGNPM